jgi:hypothetical protein
MDLFNKPGWLLNKSIQYRCTGTEGGENDGRYPLVHQQRSLDAEEAAGLTRGRWSIENRLHWFLDVCFGEDDCRVRTNRVAENLNVLRETALYFRCPGIAVCEIQISLQKRSRTGTLG